jgi:porin
MAAACVCDLKANMRNQKTLVLIGALCGAAFQADLTGAGQDAAPSTRAASTATPNGQAPASAGSAQPPITGLVHQEELTGDWAGLRTRWKDKGVVLDSSLTQFYQGVASGGTETGSEYNATAQATLEFDFGKLAGWQHWSAEVKAEWRFGGPLLGGTGTINPVNTAAMIPGTDGSKFSVTAANVTKLFPVNLKEGKLVALAVGRYNLVDLLDEDFFAGGGTERFFNIAQIGPLTVLRQVPLITNAINLIYIRGGEPFITFSVMDPNDHSLDPGLSDLFADGVTFSPGISFPASKSTMVTRRTFLQGAGVGALATHLLDRTASGQLHDRSGNGGARSVGE